MAKINCANVLLLRSAKFLLFRINQKCWETPSSEWPVNYDTLLKHSFGNYRELLEDVTLHPAMGLYLGMLRNQKADALRNIRPDENYAA